MNKKYTTEVKRASVYSEGKLAFEEREPRAYNPYARNSLVLAVNWWHGWDTAEEESKGKNLPIGNKL